MNTPVYKQPAGRIILVLLCGMGILGSCASTPPAGKISETASESVAEETLKCPSAPIVSPVPWYGNARAACSITFDDGTLDQFLAAYPELDSRGIPATFFVITDCMNQGYWMDGETRYRLFSWDDARVLSGSGHEIASHSAHHVDLAAHPDQALAEMTQSAEDLRRELPGVPVFSFGWPYWRTSPEALKAAASFFSAARSGGISDDPEHPRFGGVVGDTPENIYAVGARGILQRDTEARLTAVMDTILGSRGWLVPNFHGIESPGIEQEVLGWEALPLEIFRLILDKLEAENFWFATFGDAARYIEQRNSLEIYLVDFNEEAGIYRYRYSSQLDPEEYYMPVTLSLISPAECRLVDVLFSDSEDFQFTSILEKSTEKPETLFEIPPGNGYLEVRLIPAAGF